MPAQSIPVLSLTRTLTGTVVANRFVTIAGAATGAAAAALGVARTAGASGDEITIDVLGTTVIEAGAAIAAGVEIEADSVARGVTQSAGVVLGWSLEAAGAAGDLIEVLLIQA